MKILFQKVIILCIVAFLSTQVAVQGTTLYSNASTDTGNSLSFTNGWIMGNEIKLASGIPSANVTSFAYEIYSTEATFTGSVQMEAFLYANNGTPFNGFATPGTTLYDSGLFTLQTPLQDPGHTNAAILTFDLSGSPVPVGNDFTFAIEVTGLASNDSIGMELFNPATVGQNFGDYWLNTGGNWALLTNSVPTDFGAQFVGTVTPEPSTVSLGVMGATLLAGLVWLRRRQDSTREKKISADPDCLSK